MAADKPRPLLKKSLLWLIQEFRNSKACVNFDKGAFTYDVRFLGRQAGQDASDFIKQAYEVKYLIRVGR